MTHPPLDRKGLAITVGRCSSFRYSINCAFMSSGLEFIGLLSQREPVVRPQVHGGDH